jgi:hypothetical protein
MSAADTVRRLFVIGAGASYGAGLPDAARVLPQLILYTTGPYTTVLNRSPMELLGSLTDSLVRFAKESGVTKGDRFPLDAVTERFYDTWRENPAFGGEVMVFWQVLSEFLYDRSATRADEYRKFAKTLGPGDIVISFNWDTCLEMALHRENKPFTLSLEPKAGSRKIRVLKPHGSVDFAIGNGPIPGGPRRRFAEIVHPKMPGIQTPEGYKQPQLYRLLTYDLKFRVVMTWRGRQMDLGFAKRQAAGARSSPDVGPLHLRGFLRESMPYLLTPASPAPWYDWGYELVKDILTPAARRVGAIYVAGYSFPPYDVGVRTLLTDLSGRIGPVPVHIINPAARDLPKDVLDGMFSSYQLHACGFQEYKWRELKAGNPEK